VDREHDYAGRQQSSHEQPVGALDRAALHAVTVQQRDKRVHAKLVMAELLGSEQLSVFVGDVNVVPVAGPVNPAGCAHGFSSSVEVLLTNADQEVPWRVLIGRPSVGQRPVAALGASHPPGGACLMTAVSAASATGALPGVVSYVAEQSALPYSTPTRENSLSRKENKNYPTTQQPEVAL
jgi:hypothetical protein